MSFFGNLIKAGALVGTAYAIKKVSDKYKENNPEGVSDPEKKAEAYKDAAAEVRSEFSETVQKNIPGIKDKVNAGIQSVSDFASQKVPAAAEKVQKAVDSAADYIGTKFPEAEAKVEKAVDTVAAKAAEIIDGVTVQDKSEDFEKVVEASEEGSEFTPAEDTQDEKTEE